MAEPPPHPAETSSTVVCVPGLGLGASAWRTAKDALRDLLGARSAETLVLPGYGRRPVRGDDLRPASLGARLVADLPHRTVLVGHSASCQVVTRAASLVPERVTALVLVGPTTDPRAASWPRLAARWLLTAVREPPWQVPFLARSYSRVGLWWMQRTMEAARQEDIRVDLRAVRCPVLVVRGHHDRICPDDWARELASIAPSGSQVVTLPRGAHMVPLTHSELLAAAIGRALE